MMDTLELPVGCAGIPNLALQHNVANGGVDGRPSVVALAPWWLHPSRPPRDRKLRTQWPVDADERPSVVDLAP